jgi:hypothetical protein
LEIVPPDEDRLVEVSVHDALLPCRIFDIGYKVAVLEGVSPSLEFLLRLLKVSPGIDEESVAEFFGYNLAERSYVIREASGAGYIDRKDGRLWLAAAGEALFKEEDGRPLIFSVERRRRAFGFDLLSVAPENSRRLSPVELSLPELPVEDPVGTGNVSDRLRPQFRRFFFEFYDKKDKDQTQRRDLYSIDEISPRHRFQTTVRIKTYVRASSPYLVEDLDLSDWRADHEVADRDAVRRAAAAFIEDTKVNGGHSQNQAAYDLLLNLAPEFLKDFRTAAGLSVNRYWRAALSRAGDPRADRKTIPIAGSIAASGNRERFSALLDYGLRNEAVAPDLVFWVAPQIPCFGATTLYADIFTLVRKKVRDAFPELADVRVTCLSTGLPPRHTERIANVVAPSNSPAFPPATEIILLPGMAVVALVHAPIGSTNGLPVGLGFASFDPEVISRAAESLHERISAFRFGMSLEEPIIRCLQPKSLS